MNGASCGTSGRILAAVGHGANRRRGMRQSGVQQVDHRRQAGQRLLEVMASGQGREVAIETSVAADVRDELLRRGHAVQLRDQPGSFGGGQVIIRDPDTGVLFGGSEPRKDGAAAGW